MWLIFLPPALPSFRLPSFAPLFPHTVSRSDCFCLLSLGSSSVCAVPLYVKKKESRLLILWSVTRLPFCDGQGLDFLIALFIPVHPCHTGVTSHIRKAGLNWLPHAIENRSAHSCGDYVDTLTFECSSDQVLGAIDCMNNYNCSHLGWKLLQREIVRLH